jgi:hypothetical protein
MTHKIVTTIERDIRNQVVIDRMKQLDAKGRVMVLLYKLERCALPIACLLSFTIWVLLAAFVF